MSILFRIRACLLMASLIVVRVTEAGPINPDISVIGDIRATYADTNHDLDLGLHETEFSFVGPVNPYASAEVYVGAHGTTEFEIEEAKLVLDRYFPAGLGLTIGRYLQDFGQLNTVHSHAYPFIERPLMHSNFFSADGVLDDGVRLDWLAPIDAATLRATVGAVRGNVFLGDTEHGEEHAKRNDEGAEEETGPKVGVTGRIELFAEPGEAAFVLLGASVLHGVHDPVEDAKATWIDVDGKVKFDLGPYRSLVVNAEAVFGSLDATDEAAASDPTGWFASTDLRLNRRWNIGGFAESASERFDEDIRTNRYGGFVGLALLEESTLFRVVGHTTDPDEARRESGITVQTIFAVGPHRPHRF